MAKLPLKARLKVADLLVQHQQPVSEMSNLDLQANLMMVFEFALNSTDQQGEKPAWEFISDMARELAGRL